MSGPTRYQVGDRVAITAPSLAHIKSGCNSIRAYPSHAAFLKLKEIHDKGLLGVVTHVFPPGYEMTVGFGESAFHLKDHWVERAPPLTEPPRQRLDGMADRLTDILASGGAPCNLLVASVVGAIRDLALSAPQPADDEPASPAI